MFFSTWLDYRANCVTQYGYLGNLLIGLANALYNPNLWKANLIWGTEISEKITPQQGYNEEKDSIQGVTGALSFGQYRHLLVLSILSCLLYPRKAWHFDLRRYPGSRSG